MQLIALWRVAEHGDFRCSVRRLSQFVQRPQVICERGANASFRNGRSICSRVHARQTRDICAEGAVVFALDYDWKVLRHDLLLIGIQPCVFEDPTLKPFADFLLRVDHHGNDLLSGGVDELPMAALAGPPFDETGGLELADQFRPRHGLIIT